MTVPYSLPSGHVPGPAPLPMVERLPLLRPHRSMRLPGLPRRYLGGVCAAIALHLGVTPVFIRGLFLLFLPLGLPIYLLLFLLVPTGNPWAVQAQQQRFNQGKIARSLQERQFSQASKTTPSSRRAPLVAAVVMVAIAFLMVMTLGQKNALPAWLLYLAMFLLGTALAWSQNNRLRTAPVTATGVIISGMVLVAVAVIAAISHYSQYNPLLAALTGLAVVVVVALILVPVLIRLTQEISTARITEAREAERADIAAHLHDSVLQTLALIRQRSTDSAAVATLARSQERELRNWLYGQTQLPQNSLSDLIRQTVADIEDRDAVAVEVITVGDCIPGANGGALAAIIGESLTNAVKHAAPPFSVYAEVSGNKLQAYVRDRGRGFNPENIPEDRHGIRDSIIGRARRLGGQASIKSGPTGTEVSVTIPQEVQ